MTAGDEHELALLIRSRFPIIALDTHEEERALALLQRCAQKIGQPLRQWTVTSGLQTPDGKGHVADTCDPAAALRTVVAAKQECVFVLVDFHPFLDNPLHVRLLKEIANSYDDISRTVVLLSHETPVPAELEKQAARLSMALPGSDEILSIVKSEISAWQWRNGNAKLKGEREVFDLMLRHLVGLAETDVRRLVRAAIQDDGLLDRNDLERLIKQKHAILARDSVLSLEIETARFADVAGLTALKKWLDRRKSTFLSPVDVAGIDSPKGIMLLGVQGCGKSLAAKAVAGAWSVPLMRLDLGALYNKFLGETERNLREALKAADAMAPCVLWIDELEKGISSNDNGTDGGESRRVLGALLTWMAERKSRVFVVATSNDIEALPPELIRKGRLDEIFFVDLPDPASRMNIFRIHLAKRGQDGTTFDLERLVSAAEGFSGAEIEQAIVSAQYEAMAQKLTLGSGLIMDEIAKTRPLSVVMGERIAQLRAWAADRTVKAD